MSKRSKFVMVTWVGSNVSVMKKAKMSTDKALVKDIIQVEIQILIVKAYSHSQFHQDSISVPNPNQPNQYEGPIGHMGHSHTPQHFRWLEEFALKALFYLVIFWLCLVFLIYRAKNDFSFS